MVLLAQNHSKVASRSLQGLAADIDEPHAPTCSACTGILHAKWS